MVDNLIYMELTKTKIVGQLELTKTQVVEKLELTQTLMAGHSCEGFFFLIISLEVERFTSNLDLCGEKIPL